MTNKAIFLVGGPGSGKDIILKNILNRFDLLEFKIEQIVPILEGSKSYNLEDKSLVISTNAYDFNLISFTKKLLEENDFETSMIYVDVDDETSKNRLSYRSNFSEEKRRAKFDTSKENIEKFYKEFENFIKYDNNFLSENPEQFKSLNIFCEVFIDFENTLFESVDLNKRLLEKYTFKKSKKKNTGDSEGKYTRVYSDNVSSQDFPVRDPGFPTPTGGVGDVTSRLESFSEYEPEFPAFASIERQKVPTDSYPTKNQQKTISAIKKIAKTSWKKNETK